MHSPEPQVGTTSRVTNRLNRQQERQPKRSDNFDPSQACIKAKRYKKNNLEEGESVAVMEEPPRVICKDGGKPAPRCVGLDI